MNEPSREMDIEIAERVMGWRWLIGQHEDVSSWRGEQRWFLPPDMTIHDVRAGEWTDYTENQDGRYTLFALPHYSTEIAAGWDVVERMLSLDGPYGAYKMTFGMEFSQIIDWVAEFVPGRHHPLAREYGGVLQASGLTAPDAICRAALRWIEHLPESQSS